LLLRGAPTWQTDPEALDSFVPHSARRVAVAIVTSIAAVRDFRTIQAWGKAATPGLSAGTLRRYCRTARIVPRCALDCARLLRAVRLAETHGCAIGDVLDISEDRTLKRLLARGSVEILMEQADWSLREFIDRQRFIIDAHVLGEIRRALASTSAP